MIAPKLPDSGGHFGPFGGRFVPEALVGALDQLSAAYTDAMADPRAEAHDYSLTRVFPRIGETGTTREIIDLMERSA